MDFTLRCNSLKCRAQLAEKAVVTTCSHLFCVPCAEDLGLLKSAWAQRHCPACQTLLSNPDDAVATSMNPSEDYKTSVLSGLSPNIIMECAGRAMAFWSYQATQEMYHTLHHVKSYVMIDRRSIYQEYLARTLTEKYGNLSLQMDNIINEANTEMDGLNQKIEAMKINEEKLKQENMNIAHAFREKNRKYQQLDGLYSALKRKEMTAMTQSAAYDTADEVLQSASTRQNLGTPGNPSFRYTPRNETMQTHFTHDGQNAQQQQRPQQSHFHLGHRARMQEMGPPPPPNAGLHQPGLGAQHGSNATPSLHRTRLGQGMQTTPQQPQRENRPGGPLNSGSATTSQAPLQRNALGDTSNNPGSRSGVSGYGMSAGMKVGRQQGNLQAARPDPPAQPTPPPFRQRLGPN